ncbi:hypothetical protein [Aureliella helgolandensis]|uniref:hypothetical protein n=1 Tax=Aureliella helgolandensis TaxID=2527968 RepID=UPI0011A6B884|nr:hypothetical protein [Aureliella helgolandensis]
MSNTLLPHQDGSALTIGISDRICDQRRRICEMLAIHLTDAQRCFVWNLILVKYWGVIDEPSVRIAAFPTL